MVMYFSIFLILFVSFFFLNSSNSQTLSQEKQDKILKISNEYFPDNSPGAVVMISKNGEIEFLESFGNSDIEKNVKVKTNDVFRIGSITKQFTAVAILQLIEQGKISLQDEITKFIPDYPTNGQKITIEHLLTHTSGIKSYTSMVSFDAETQKTDVTTVELIDFFKDQPMDFNTDENWIYNNSGYVLLGYIIEHVTGMSYCEYIEKNIFQKIGMTNSYCGDVPRLINGYRKDGEGYSIARELSMSWPHAAGMLLSTVEDLNKWNNAIINDKILSDEMKNLAFKEYILPSGKPTAYGYGWFIGNLQGVQTIEHGGGINGFVTNAIYIPSEKIYVVVLSNYEAANANDLSERIAAIVINRPYEYLAIEIDEDKAGDYIGVYVDDTGDKRVISLSEGQMISQRSGGPRFNIFQYETDKFFFENSMTKINFMRDAENKVIGLKMNHRLSPESYWTKTDEVVEELRSIQLNEDILDKYTGTYQISPTFEIVITTKDGSIFATPTDQQTFQLHPETETLFFLKEVDAKVEFVMNDSGEVSKLILYQGGAEIEGIRK